MKFIDKYDNYVTKPEDAPTKQKVSAYGMLIIGSYLLLTQDIGVPFREIPGGTVDEGENEQDALVRELKEEAGLEVRVTADEPIATHTEHFYDNTKDVYFKSTRKVYPIEMSSNTLDIGLIIDSEIASVGFYHVATLADIKLQDFIRKAVDSQLNLRR